MRNLSAIVVWAVLTVWAWAAPAAWGDVRHVPGEYLTIQAAIDAAVNGDEVVLAQGEYHESFRTLGKDITIRSTFPYDDEVVRSTALVGSGPDGFDEEPALRVDPNPSAEPRIVGLTFRDWRRYRGDDRGGGAVVIGESTAQAVGNAYPFFERCVFTDNRVLDGHGGAVANHGGVATFTDCRFESNAAGWYSGGGAILVAGSVDAFGCVFEDNYASKDGGAIYQQPGHFRAFGCDFIANGTAGDGSVVAGDASNFSLFEKCRFIRNRAEQRGTVSIPGQSFFISCLFAGNAARSGASVIELGHGDELWLNNCTIAGNGERSGQAVFRVAGRFPYLRIENCVLGPGGASAEVAADVEPFCGIEANYSVLSAAMADAIFKGVGNVVEDPLFVVPPDGKTDGFGDDLATFSHDESANDDYGDLRLAPGSPAIDAGGDWVWSRDIDDADDDGVTREFPPYDLAGAPRLTDNPDVLDTGVPFGPWGIVADMGAYETPGRVCLADVAFDGVLNNKDLNAFVNAFVDHGSAADMNGDGVFDNTDINLFVNAFMGGCD